MIGVGIDIIEVSRIRAMLRKHNDRFLERVFTPAEQAYCTRSVRSDEHFAARFAAKEAAMKALGTGLSGGIQWIDIEVTHDPNGRPVITLHGEAKAVAERLGISKVLVSLTHIKSAAAACVIAE
jgi:holo-[acyl-carrier protein] synthase